MQKYMALRQFIPITSDMRFTNKHFPSFLDRFHDVQQMINNFNAHYLENYTPSWIGCLDESMNYFMEKLCPGFMSVPHKPYPLGNEYHSITDGDEVYPVMYQIKIQYGKYRPKDANGKWVFPSNFEGENLNTGRKYTNTSILMCEMKVPLHGTGKIVSMESGFCVTVVILHLHEHGVYGKLLIKKRKYWTNGCPGAHIDSYMEGKPLGFVKTLMQDMVGVPFNIHFTRAYRFVTKLMSTHGLLNEVPDNSTYRKIMGSG